LSIIFRAATTRHAVEVSPHDPPIQATSIEMLKYSAHHYDETLLLKVPALLWLAILYGLRHFFFVVVAGLMPMDIVTIPWINFQTSPYFMVTDLPAALVLFAIGHRVPDALTFMRLVWQYGRWLLTASYLGGIALFAYLNKEVMTDPSSWDFPDAMLVVVIDILFVVYLMRSELVRDVFADFPRPAKPLRKESSSAS
jgi:hypothetical protein